MPRSGSDKISASASEAEAEDGLHASSSSTAGPNRAPGQLRGQASRHQADSNRVHGNVSNDLASKLATITLEYGPRSSSTSTTSTPTTGSSAQSVTSSMALSAGSRTTVPSSYSGSSRYSWNTLPSLCETSATLKSISVTSAGRADSGIGQVYHLQTEQEEAQDSADEIDPVRLECCFKFLSCGEVFDDLETWDRHCRTHFRRRLPPEAACPFQGCDWKKRAQSGQDVWDRRLRHMQQEHDDTAYVGGRPDGALLEHLRCSEIISLAAYQELRLHGRVSEQAVLNTASSRQGREEHRRRR